MNYLSLISLLSFAGMLDAGYLLYTRLAGVAIACGPVFHGCADVAASSYSTVLGVPLSAYGLLFYIALFKVSIHMNYQLLERVGLSALRQYLFLPQMLLVASTLGFVCSAYFTYLQAFVINAWCMYCVISACLSTIIFIATLVGLQEKKNIQNI